VTWRTLVQKQLGWAGFGESSTTGNTLITLVSTNSRGKFHHNKHAFVLESTSYEVSVSLHAVKLLIAISMLFGVKVQQSW
jgi:hypothetical protein